MKTSDFNELIFTLDMILALGCLQNGYMFAFWCFFAKAVMDLIAAVAALRRGE